MIYLLVGVGKDKLALILYPETKELRFFRANDLAVSNDVGAEYKLISWPTFLKRELVHVTYLLSRTLSGLRCALLRRYFS